MALIPVHTYQGINMGDPKAIDHVYKNMPYGLDEPRRCKTNKRRSAILRASQPDLDQEQMPLTTEYSLEERKKTRNRIAQRKHRERKCVVLPRACGAEDFGSPGLKHDSVPGTIGEGERKRDRSQSFSPTGSTWETTWESLAQSFSPRFSMEDQTDCKDQLRYQTRISYNECES